MRCVCLRSVIGGCAVLILVATGRAAALPGFPAIIHVGTDSPAAPNSTGAFRIVNLGQDPISSAQIDLSSIKDSAGNLQAFETGSGTTPLTVSPSGSHGIDASALDGQPAFTGGAIGGSANLFPILSLSFKPNTFGPGATLAFNVPVAQVDPSGAILNAHETGSALAGGLVSVNTPSGTATGTLFVPPPRATGDHDGSLALLASAMPLTGGEDIPATASTGVPEPASLLVWSIIGLGGCGLRRRQARAA